MYPEKKIVNIWLNQQGYSVVNNINAGNQVVDTLAIKLKRSEPIEVKHIEVSCSVTKTADKPEAIQSKFNSKHVHKTIKDYLGKHFGQAPEYENMLITTTPYNIPGIKDVPFSHVITEVLQGLDKQNYNDPILRTLQLVKFIALTSPKGLSKLMAKQSKLLSHQSRSALLNYLLEDQENINILAKKSFEPSIMAILKESGLSNPDKLFNAINTQLLSNRSKKRFMTILEKQTEKPVPKSKEKPLDYYLKRG
ncbi:MAG: hypothetical protein ABIG95_02390 [Candidatus Woesearchaeota archaeon]